MHRVSPSLLESYRLYLDDSDQLAWFDVDKMKAAITGDFIPTPPIKLGWAFHAMLEDFTDTHDMYFNGPGNPSSTKMLVNVTRDFGSYTFDYEKCVVPFSDFLSAGCIHEVKGYRIIDTDYGPVSIATKADAVVGNIGGEWKTTEKSIQIMKYYDSVQWKVCAWVLNLIAIDYRVVQLVKGDDGIYTVKNYDAIQCVWSDSLLDEIHDLVNGLVDFHYSQGLESYLVPFYERPENKEAQKNGFKL